MSAAAISWFSILSKIYPVLGISCGLVTFSW